MHIQPDNTHYVGKWKTCTPFVGQVKEEDMIPCLLPIGQERVKKILEQLLQNGVAHIQAQCQVDPMNGLKNMEAFLQSLKLY